MAHLDVVPVEGDWQHGAVQRRHRGRLDLGSRHPRRQGPAGGGLRGRGAAAREGAHPGPGRLAVVRLRRGGVRAGRADGRRGAPEPRRAAVDRHRRGRRDRARRVPRGEQAGRRRRRDREGRHLARAHRRGPRRSRVDPVQARPDGTAGARDHPARQRTDAGERPRTPRSSSSRGWRRTRPSPCARSWRTPEGSVPSSPAHWCSPGRRPRRWPGPRSR